MSPVQFFTVSGAASTTNAAEIVGADTSRDRLVRLVLDNTNWFIELAAVKQPGQGARARVPMTGFFDVVLPAGQALLAFARLNPDGGAGTQWDLSVTVMDAPT